MVGFCAFSLFIIFSLTNLSIRFSTKVYNKKEDDDEP